MNDDSTRDPPLPDADAGPPPEEKRELASGAAAGAPAAADEETRELDRSASEGLDAPVVAAGNGAAEGGGDGEVDLEEGEPPPPTFEPPSMRLKTFTMESVRAQVARALVTILAVVILFSFLTLWLISPPPAIGDLEKLLTIIFGPLVALVSGAVGYYFGGKSDESQGGG